MINYKNNSFKYINMNNFKDGKSIEFKLSKNTKIGNIILSCIAHNK